MLQISENKLYQVIGFLIAISIAFNTKLSESPPLFLSNIILFSVSCIMLFNIRKAIIPYFLSDVKLTGIVFLIISISGVLSIGNINMHVVYPKIILGLFTYYAFSRFFFLKKKSLEIILLSFCIGTAISPIFQVSIAGLKEVSSSNRIEVDNLGNFNAYGFLIAQSLIISIYLLQQIRGKLYKLSFALLQLPILFVLLYTFSRGALFALIFGYFIYIISSSGKRKTYLLTIAVIIFFVVIFFLQKLNLTEIFQDRFLNTDNEYDSGRLIIYSILLNNLFSSLLHFFFGFGLGAINLKIFIESDIQSAHSTFLDCLYSFGIVGLFFLLRFILKVTKGLLKLPNTSIKSLCLALVGQLILSFFYDSYWGATQIGWLIPFMFAIFASLIRSHKVEGLHKINDSRNL